MTITRKQLRKAVVNAESLGNKRDVSTLRDLASNQSGGVHSPLDKRSSRRFLSSATLLKNSRQPKVLKGLTNCNGKLQPIASGFCSWLGSSASPDNVLTLITSAIVEWRLTSFLQATSGVLALLGSIAKDC